MELTPQISNLLTRVVQGVETHTASSASEAKQIKALLVDTAPDAYRTTSRANGSVANMPEKTERTRRLRLQSVRYELNANSGRYCSRSTNVATSGDSRLATHPFVWMVVPLSDSRTAKFFTFPATQLEPRSKQI